MQRRESVNPVWWFLSRVVLPMIAVACIGVAAYGASVAHDPFREVLAKQSSDAAILVGLQVRTRASSKDSASVTVEQSRTYLALPGSLVTGSAFVVTNTGESISVREAAGGAWFAIVVWICAGTALVRYWLFPLAVSLGRRRSAAR